MALFVGAWAMLSMLGSPFAKLSEEVWRVVMNSNKNFSRLSFFSSAKQDNMSIGYTIIESFVDHLFPLSGIHASRIGYNLKLSVMCRWRACCSLFWTHSKTGKRFKLRTHASSVVPMSTRDQDYNTTNWRTPASPAIHRLASCRYITWRTITAQWSTASDVLNWLSGLHICYLCVTCPSESCILFGYLLVKGTFCCMNEVSMLKLGTATLSIWRASLQASLPSPSDLRVYSWASVRTHTILRSPQTLWKEAWLLKYQWRK